VITLINWQKLSKESPIEWLLEETNPSVRYFALRDVLGKNENNPKLQLAKESTPDSKTVKRIFERQRQGFYWENQMRPYLPKYKASYWTIMLLAQLGVDRTDRRMENACESIFQFQLDEGGFANELGQKTGEHEPSREISLTHVTSPGNFGIYEHQMSCLTGNISAALIRAGYANDRRVVRALEWLVKIQNQDGGWLCPYWRAHIRDKHGCFYGTICPMEAFSEVQVKDVNTQMKTCIDRGAEFLLMHHLFKADHHNFRVINQSWLKLGFPWFYGYNILRGLDVLTRLRYVKDKRLNDAFELLLLKRRKDGAWILESTPAGRMQTNIEVRGKPSKWITLIALRTLKRWLTESS
jgi:hypothetical protein